MTMLVRFGGGWGGLLWKLFITGRIQALFHDDGTEAEARMECGDFPSWGGAGSESRDRHRPSLVHMKLFRGCGWWYICTCTAPLPFPSIINLRAMAMTLTF